MAKQTLTWKNLELNAMPADLRKAFTAYHQAHDAMVAWLEADAKKRGKLTGSVKISVRQTEIGFAMASGSSRNVVTDTKSLWD